MFSLNVRFPLRFVDEFSWKESSTSSISSLEGSVFLFDKFGNDRLLFLKSAKLFFLLSCMEAYDSDFLLPKNN